MNSQDCGKVYHLNTLNLVNKTYLGFTNHHQHQKWLIEVRYTQLKIL